MNIVDIITGAAQRNGLDPNAMLAIGQIESRLNPRAQNPRSSAGGLFQFVDSTWRQYGGGANKYDPVANAEAAGRYLTDVRKTLTKVLGRDPSVGELYLGHQQGPGGASKLLGNPNAPAAQLVGQRAVTANGGQPGMTAQQFAGLWMNKAEKAAGAPLPPARPLAEAFAPPGPDPNAMLASAIVQAANRPRQQLQEEQEAEEERRRALFGDSRLASMFV